MPKPPVTTPGAQARLISLDLILPRTFAPTQDLEAQQPLFASSNPKRSHVFIRDIALRLYAKQFEGVWS